MNKHIKSNSLFPLLESKITIPLLSYEIIDRIHPLSHINSILRKKLCIISAPAGYGKTTLIVNFLNHLNDPIAWYAIDENDSTFSTFFNYFIHSIQKIDSKIGNTALNLLNSPRNHSEKSILITLLNDLFQTKDDKYIVLDDYHHINCSEIHSSLDYILSHIPTNLHFIIASRYDPPLSTSKYRLRNELSEIRAADLKFTAKECKRLFKQRFKRSLEECEIQEILKKTEGWITGIQLAGLGMSSAKNHQEFINNFKRNDQLIIDYLFEEVFTSQTIEIKNFLLQTSILQRFNHSLCNKVCDHTNSHTLIHYLEKNNIFIFPLDYQKYWYRYHHLFSNLLFKKLMHESPQKVKTLHLKAAEWYRENNINEEALHHFLKAEKYIIASKLISEIAEDTWDRGKQQQILNWFEHIPSEYYLNDPDLKIYYCRSLIMSNQTDKVNALINSLEDFLFKNTKSIAQYQSRDIGRIKGRFYAVKSILSTYRGDIKNIISNSMLALKYLSENDLNWRVVTSSFLGMAHGWSGDGDMKKAYEAFKTAENLSITSNNQYFYLFAKSSLASILSYMGQLHEALKIFQELTDYVKDSNFAYTGQAGTIYSGKGTLLCEFGDIESGEKWILKGVEICRNGFDLIALAASYFSLSRVHFYRRRYVKALEIIEKIDEIKQTISLPPWMEHTLSASRARFWLEKGDLHKVSSWIHDKKMNIEDEIAHRTELEFAVFARYLLLQGNYEDCQLLINRLLQLAENGNRYFNYIEFAKIFILNHFHKSQYDTALAFLGRILFMGEKGGFFNIFTNENQEFAVILELFIDDLKDNKFDSRTSPSLNYVKKIILAYKVRNSIKKEEKNIVSLSDRENEVLLYISKGFTNQQIAEELFVSLNTIRTHTKNIYSKLDVHSRIQAVSRAKALRII